MSDFKWIGANDPQRNVVITIPHAGERIPREATWLHDFELDVLLTDVDRFVDQIYEPLAKKIPVPMLIADIHRYAVDLNRIPTDVDWSTVEKTNTPAGTFPKGFHWKKTTDGVELITKALSPVLHRQLTELYFDPFFKSFEDWIKQRRKFDPDCMIYHLDAHSMPSRGTPAHDDPGGERAEVVLSDRMGDACSPAFMALVKAQFEAAKFKVAINDPYKGGRITERYGKPLSNHQTIQIELNRALYMNEITKEKLPVFEAFKERIGGVIEKIIRALPLSA